MVYESDFYTTRRPYTRPLASSYTVTGSTYIPISSVIQVRSYPHLPYVAHKRLVTIVHTPIHSAYHTGTPIPIRIHSRVRPSVLAAEYSRIRALPRPSSRSYTEQYLNSKNNILFDDETREIRAKADSLLRRIHVFVPRPLTTDFEEEILPERMRSDDYIRRLLGARKNVKKEIETLPWYTLPEKRNLGKGNLAAIQYVAGKPHSRRRPYFKLADLKPVDVRSDVNVMSFYSKNREAAAEASPSGHPTERELRKAKAVEPEWTPSPAPAPKVASPIPEVEEVVEKKKENKEKKKQKEVRKPTPEEEAKKKAEEFLRKQAEEVRRRAEEARKQDEEVRIYAEHIRLEEERRKAAEEERLRLEEEAEQARIELEKAQEEARLTAIAEELEAQRLETERLAEAKRLEEEEAMAAEAERIAIEAAAAEEQQRREEERIAAEAAEAAAVAAEETRQEEEERPAGPIADDDAQIDEEEVVHEDDADEKCGSDTFVEEPIDIEAGESQPEESNVADDVAVVVETDVDIVEESIEEPAEEPLEELVEEPVEEVTIVEDAADADDVAEQSAIVFEDSVPADEATSGTDDIWGDNEDA